MAALTITASQVIAGADADFYQGLAGETITAGKSCYLDELTNRIRLADANGSLETAEVKGIALNAASNGQALRLQTGGTITLGAGAAPVLSTIYIVGATAGDIAPAADLGSGWYTSVLGVGGASNTLKMKIHNSHSQKA